MSKRRHRDIEDGAAAFQRVEPEALRLTDEELRPMNLDVIAATATLLRIAPRILALRNEIARLPHFDMRDVDCLVDRAKAVRHAAMMPTPEPTPTECPMLAEYTQLRRSLLSYARAFAYQKTLDGAALARINRASGGRLVPDDLSALVALFRSNWDEVRKLTNIASDVPRAEIVGPAVYAAVYRLDSHGRPLPSEHAVRVRRFWTLVDRSYDACQRAITYLRWHEGDAATIAPSLRLNPGRRGPRKMRPGVVLQ